jgi:two-component system, NtrC family, sensor kinase
VHRLDQFSVDDLIGCRDAFRAVGEAATSMEEAAGGIVRYLRTCVVDAEGSPACPLVRLYKTHRFDDLPEPLQQFAGRSDPVGLSGATRCLTLLGTAGSEPSWNDRTDSKGHQAIPLVTEAVVERSPMIVSLILQLGLDVGSVVHPEDRDPLDLHHRDYDVFFVPDALGSPMVPAQDGFVVPYGIRSVVGCGGVLPTGDLFALILFTRVLLEPSTAELFRTMALSVKATIVPFTFKVFSA